VLYGSVPICRSNILSVLSASFNTCPHYPTFSFASPKEKVAKRKGDFGPMAPPAQKWLYAVI
jgi:hypothetical protein